jgi:hypothetical protein
MTRGLNVGFGNLSADTASFIGEAMWSGIPDGSPININVEQKRIQDRFAKAGITTMIPWQTMNDDLVQKAIFSDPNMEAHECAEFATKIKETMDKRTLQYFDAVLQKAESTTNTSALMHVIADEGVTYLYKRPYPIQTLIPVEANKGKTASWDSVGPYEFGNAAFGAEDPSLTESDITTHNRTDTIKYMYAVGRLTKAVKLAGLAQIPVRDIKAIRVDTAQDALRALRERSLLGVTRDVSSTTNEFAEANTLQYKGMYELITAASAYANKCYNAVTTVDTYGEIMIELDKSFNQMVKMGMSPNIAICDYKTFGIIRRGLAEYFRYTGEPVKTLIPGLSKIDLVFPNTGGLSLVPHAFLSMTAGNNGSIFLIDTRLMARRVLWQDTYEELANINTSDKFVISAAETLIEKSDVDGSSSLQGGVFGITI